MLRGLLRERRHWGSFLPILQQKLPDRSIITPDIPGNGALYRQQSPCSITEITESLRKRNDFAANAEKMDIIAISMGGMIALDWMSRYPKEIGRAVLINTSVRPYSPFYHRLRPRNYLNLLKLLRRNPSERERMILSLTSNRHQRNARLLNQWSSWCEQNPVSKQNALRQLLASATFKFNNKPEQPLLVICSKTDRLVSYRCSAALAQAWSASYLEHPCAGHDLPLDDPEWLTERIADWLSTPV